MIKSRKLIKRLVPLLILSGLMCSLLTGCGESKMLQSELSAMNTMVTITAYGNKAESGIQAAASVINALNTTLDPNSTTSYTYALNNANGASVVVSGQIASMISTAKTVYDQSSGSLDLTIAPLVDLWGFNNSKFYVPTDDEISTQLKRLCFDKLVLTSFPSTGTYTVSMPADGELTFAPVAKGCASQDAVDAMRQAGVESGIISMEGNVQTLGTKPDGSNWNVAVTDPNNISTYLGVLSVGETAVVTTAGYQRKFTDMNGNTYQHIISPVSGYPTTNSLVAVTIVCDDGLLADALSTAMFVLGQSRALSYWRTYGGFDMILVNSSNEVICTSGLIESFTLSSPNYTLSYSE